MIREEKKIKVSQKRQITIPKEFCMELNITDKVKIYMDEGRICIEAMDKYDEFRDSMLEQLKKEGYRGKDLEEKIIEQKDMINTIFHEMVREIQREEYGSNASSTDDVQRLGGSD